MAVCLSVCVCAGCIARLLPDLSEMEEVTKALERAMDLCARKGRDEPEHHDALWFALLDRLAHHSSYAYLI